MKKMRIMSLMLFLTLVLSVLALAQSTNPYSCDANGREKNAFSTLEVVFVKSSTVCTPNTEVSVYITDDKLSWVPGDVLIDVRGAAQKVTTDETAKLPLTRLWGSPIPGIYDIVVDCNNNGQYDSEPVDSFGDAGFKITAVAGKATVSAGINSPLNQTWQYDPEDESFEVVVLQSNLLVQGEAMSLNNLTLKSSGTGDDSKIKEVSVYLDEGQKGKLDNEDSLLGSSQPAYSEDQGTTLIFPSLTLDDNIPKDILIVYSLDKETPEGEYFVMLESISGVGVSSRTSVRFAGTPLSSNLLKIVPEKICLGELNLKFEPSPVEQGLETVATASGMESCVGKTILFRTNPCASLLQTQIGSCIVQEGKDGCEFDFVASASKTYYACIDKNGDGDLTDFGEYALSDLTVYIPETTEEVVDNGGNEELFENISEAGTEDNESAGITGNIIGDLKDSVAQSGSFFILLEITLLLILLVLVMILFKLRPGATTKEE